MTDNVTALSWYDSEEMCYEWIRHFIIEDIIARSPLKNYAQESYNYNYIEKSLQEQEILNNKVLF